MFAEGDAALLAPEILLIDEVGFDRLEQRDAANACLFHSYRFSEPKDTLKEMFVRLVFNILCGNTDDHARNHAAFWNGKELTLTPAYDICPQGRAGNVASQAMKISGDKNLSQLRLCLEIAHHFLLSENDAEKIFEQLETTIRQYWREVCEEAQLNEIDKKLLWGRQFLNPFSFEK